MYRMMILYPSLKYYYFVAGVNFGNLLENIFGWGYV
jgi:hypothetical protein